MMTNPGLDARHAQPVNSRETRLESLETTGLDLWYGVPLFVFVIGRLYAVDGAGSGAGNWSRVVLQDCLQEISPSAKRRSLTKRSYAPRTSPTGAERGINSVRQKMRANSLWAIGALVHQGLAIPQDLGSGVCS